MKKTRADLSLEVLTDVKEGESVEVWKEEQDEKILIGGRGGKNQSA